MKGAFTSVVVAVVLAAALVAARAEPLPPAVIAIIDYRALEQKSDVGLDVKRQVDAYKAEKSAREDALLAEAQELERQRTILAPAVFKDKALAFKTKADAAGQEYLERDKRFQDALDIASEKILRTILVIVAEIAEDRKFNIVLDGSQALFVVKSLDITRAAMEKLNDRLSTVTVAVPAE